MTSTAPTAHRAQTLITARGRIGLGLVLYTALVAVLWIVPKGDWGPLWLLFAIPAVAFVLLVRKMVGGKAAYESRMGLVIGFGALLAVLWMAGWGFMGAGGSGTGVLAMLWLLLNSLWPLVMVAGLLARYILRKIVPGAAQKDAVDRAQHIEEARRQRAEAARQTSIEQARQREIEYELRMQREVNSQAEPTAAGRFTGFEPAALAAVEIPELPSLFGAPGAGLSGSGFEADKIAKGQAGELNFARALQHSGLLDRFATFWSVHMPDDEVGASTTYSSDIDCVVVTGSTIHLLDMKNFTQGDVTWTIEDGELRLLDNPTGGYIGKARSMSRNMALAADRVQSKFRALGVDHQIRPAVVFMPTDNGIGTIDPSVRWPGGIPAENLDRTLDVLRAEPPFDREHPDSEHIVRVFRWLVKDESGAAPRPGEAWKRAPGMRRPSATPPSPRPAAGTSGAGAAAGSAAAGGTAGESAATASSGAAADAASTASAPGGATRTCQECGAAFGAEWTFCWECGRA